MKLRRNKDANGNPLYEDFNNMELLFELMLDDMPTAKGFY